MTQGSISTYPSLDLARYSWAGINRQGDAVMASSGTRQSGGENALGTHPIYRMPMPGQRYVMGKWHPHRVTSRGIKNELKSLVKSSYRGSPSARFLVFGRARSGTTLLTRMLNQLSDVTCDGERLHYGMLAPSAHLRRLARLSPSATYGCKLLTYQLVEVQRVLNPVDFFQRLVDQGVRLIWIERNCFDVTLSFMIARHHGKFVHLKDDRIEGEAFAIAPDDFIDQLRFKQCQLDFERQVMARFDAHHIVYERDLADAEEHQQTIDRIAGYLGTATTNVMADTRKVVAKRTAPQVSNIDEIMEAVRASGLGHLLAGR